MFPDKPKDKKLVYLDHAATTYVDLEVKQAMDPFFSDQFANPSGLYGIGRETSSVMSKARRNIAEVLHTLPDSIIFTSGGTESDNLAIFGIANKHSEKGKHIITTKIEHHAVIHPMELLEKQGFEITYLESDETGQVDIKELVKAIRPDTILVSLMYANNEIGVILPIADIGREILKWRKKNNTIYPFFHSDACQAAGVLEMDVEKLHVDLLSFNGSKIYGPKGIGVLYKRRGTNIQPMVYGGEQEMKMRAGTENVPGIVGISKALERMQENKGKENKRLTELRDYFWKQIQEKITKVILNGPEMGEDRLPNNLNISILDVEGEALLLYLDEYGIVCSTGSACTSGSLEPSHVLTNCGLPYEYAHGSLRFSLGKRSTKEDIDYVMKYLQEIVEKLREISPVNLALDPKKNKHAKIHQR